MDGWRRVFQLVCFCGRLTILILEGLQGLLRTHACIYWCLLHIDPKWWKKKDYSLEQKKDEHDCTEIITFFVFRFSFFAFVAFLCAISFSRFLLLRLRQFTISQSQVWCESAKILSFLNINFNLDLFGKKQQLGKSIFIYFNGTPDSGKKQVSLSRVVMRKTSSD